MRLPSTLSKVLLWCFSFASNLDAPRIAKDQLEAVSTISTDHVQTPMGVDRPQGGADVDVDDALRQWGIDPDAMAKGKGTKEQPNILIILTDDQDDHMGGLDYMPNLHKYIIEQGSYHPSHYCTIALCCPSRTSMWTGLHGHNHNVTDVGGIYGGYPQVVKEGHNDNNVFLWMQEAGYNTYYVGKLYNGQDEGNYNNPPAHGFTHSDMFVGKYVYYYHNVSHSYDFGPIEYSNGLLSTELVEQRIAGDGGFIDMGKEAGKPWLMVAAPTAPHVQIGPTGIIPPVPAKKYEKLYEDFMIPRLPHFNPDTPGGASYYRLLKKLNQTVIDYNDEFQRHRLRALKSVDDMIETVFQKLEATGQLENTYVVLTTDNGFHISQHRLPGGKECGLETDIRIPFAVRGPGIHAGSKNYAVTNHVDISPTLLALAGAETRPHLDGGVMPWVEGMDAEMPLKRREHTSTEFWGDAQANQDGGPYWETFGPKGWLNNTFYSVRIIGEDYSFYYSVWCTNEHELYEMNSDPYQLNNLFYDESAQSSFTFQGRSFGETINRLDTLLLTLKTCSGESCRHPWETLMPGTNVETLSEAMVEDYDGFFDEQPKVSYTQCSMGHLAKYEGAQAPNTLKLREARVERDQFEGRSHFCEDGPLLWM